MATFEEADAYLMKGIQLEGLVEHSGNEVREKSKNAYGSDRPDARLAFTAVLADVLTRKEGIPGDTNPSRSHRLTLIATFMQGMNFTERLISEGYYAKAAAVLKQDYEIMTRIAEEKKGVAKRGVTPNVKFAPPGSQRLYGELNDVAHPSQPEILGKLLGEYSSGAAQAVGVCPVFRGEVATNLYDCHVFVLGEIAREAIILYEEMYNDKEGLQDAVKWFVTAMGFLEKAGFKVET